jgi:hypothetical protein
MRDLLDAVVGDFLLAADALAVHAQLVGSVPGVTTPIDNILIEEFAHVVPLDEIWTGCVWFGG